MADTILTAVFSRPQFVVTNEGQQAVIWQGVATVDVEIDSSAAVTDHPLAIDGPKDAATTSTIQAQDIQVTKIIQPARLRVNAIISDISTIEAIITVFKDETATLSITTKSIITNNLVMTELDIEQTADMISASRVSMTFEQVLPPENSGFQPEQPADGSVYGVGVQNLQTVSPLATLSQYVSIATSRPPAPLPPGVLINNIGGPFILDSATNGRLS